MSRTARILSTMAILGWCVSDCRAQATPGPASGASDIIFVADGAGSKSQLSSNLTWLASEKAPHLHVVNFYWASVDAGADIRNQQQHVLHGYKLACRVATALQANPNRKVYLVGYGAGASICLAAAEHLPPQSVQRMFLLSPRVGYQFDLRPALRVSRDGIDSFFNPDSIFLADTNDKFGTSDGTKSLPAGLVGFRGPVTSPEDAALYSKLRQQQLNISHWGYTTSRFAEQHIINALR